MLFWFDSWKVESYFFSRVTDWSWRFENIHIQPICTDGAMWYPGLYSSSVSLFWGFNEMIYWSLIYEVPHSLLKESGRKLILVVDVYKQYVL